MITPILSDVKTNKSYYLTQDSTYRSKLGLRIIFNLGPLGKPILILNLIILFNTSIIYAAGETASTFDFEESSRWTTGEKMPTPRTELLADSIEDKIYVIGGVDYSKGGQLKTVEIYDTKKNEWITNAKALPQAIDHGGSSV